MIVACGPAADRAVRPQPGELMRLVAAGLTASGYNVRPPGRDGGCRMTLSCRGARCAVSVTDWADIEWECRPRADGAADPWQIADLATTLLTGRAGDHARRGSGYGRDSLTFKGIVGLELKARGLDVGLEVYEDKDYFDALAEIVVTSPVRGHDAAVRVADDGSITWTRDYWAEAAATTSESEFCAWIADPAKVTAAVVDTITAAMSQLAPDTR